MADSQTVAAVLDEMSASMASTRALFQSLTEKQSPDDFDTRDGISLLSVKHHLMLSYLHSLVLLIARRAAGDALEDRTPPSLPFSAPDRGARGAGSGDLVDSMIEGRIVLEKIRLLESRIRYQIEKLVRIADDASKNVADDPLVFRPNPQNLVNNDQASDAVSDEDGDQEANNHNGVYRPPKLAPMPYTESAGDKRSKRQPVPKALSSLLHQDPSRPHIESSSGLGAMPALASSRAREIQRMTEFEEDNFTRLVMKKRDARRRRQDEADLALGGTGSSHGQRSRGLEDEFEDVLRSAGRTRAGAIGDGYEELRQQGKKADALSRSRTRMRDVVEHGEDDDAHQVKRSRFQKERRALGKKLTKARRRQ